MKENPEEALIEENRQVEVNFNFSLEEEAGEFAIFKKINLSKYQVEEWGYHISSAFIQWATLLGVPTDIILTTLCFTSINSSPSPEETFNLFFKTMEEAFDSLEFNFREENFNLLKENLKKKFVSSTAGDRSFEKFSEQLKKDTGFQKYLYSLYLDELEGFENE
jgi:hypothetical protein